MLAAGDCAHAQLVALALMCGASITHGFLDRNRGVRNTPKKRTRFRNPEILLEISGFPLGFQTFSRKISSS